jgi:hypothetical protein
MLKIFHIEGHVRIKTSVYVYVKYFARYYDDCQIERQNKV